MNIPKVPSAFMARAIRLKLGPSIEKICETLARRKGATATYKAGPDKCMAVMNVFQELGYRTELDNDDEKIWIVQIWLGH